MDDPQGQNMETGIDTGAYVLQNAWESMVKEAVAELQPKMGMCGCLKCYCDACAIALNNLEPRYVTTFKGTVYSKLPQLHSGSRADIHIVVAKALQKVKESPNHEPA